MFRKLVPLAIATFLGVVVIPLPQKASATTPLTRAVVKRLHNLVQLMPQNRPKRRARRRDTMTPGDGLATGRASLADLRFNDGSLARIGERAVFKFLPRTRTFRLSNGTVLLLIPPGQGRTRVRTRSAAATIRGSALFVRYDEQTDTTVVGSLTNSGIEVFNQDESRSQVLKAGQLIVVVKGRIQGLYNFDLRTFYETSDLVRGLDLNNPSDRVSSDPAMASVQAETSEALEKQVPIQGDKVVENPSFIKLSPVSSDAPSEEVAQDNLPVNNLVDNGQIIIKTPKKNEDKSSSDSGNSTTSPTPSNPSTGSETPTTPVTPTTPENPPTTGGGTPTTPVTPTTPENPPTTGGGTPTTPVTPTTPENP
ncbi:MAG: FecR family protein, partial [Rivularia sp. ALOHA_DT_140]|nr:FecR family protein [Rivularia sp. ALOHA_DT_140]